MTISFETEARVTRLMSDYAHCIDDERYEAWPDFFVEDCVYRIITRDSRERGHLAGIIECESRGMLRDRINSMRRANVYEPHVYRHLLGPLRIVSEDERGIRARTGFAALRVVQGQSAEMFVTGVYDDVIHKEQDRLRFAERIVTLDSSRIDTLLVIPL